MANTDAILRDTINMLKKMKSKINNIFSPIPNLEKTYALIDESINIINDIIRKKKYDYPDLASKIYEKTDEINKNIFNIRKNPNLLLEEIKKLRKYIAASYYDFTGEIDKVRKAYREFITAFTITLILLPIFFGFSILFIGFLLFPLLISIHAYRARRKLGLIISSALIPISLFICFQAMLYMLYAFMDNGEIYRIVNALNISPLIAYIIVIVIGGLGTIGLILSLKSFLTLYKSLDAFI